LISKEVLNNTVLSI